tara:strand:- start:289 stop:492 length:204 start_codon:yes stop_codon:yes gene_type:complete
MLKKTQRNSTKNQTKKKSNILKKSLKKRNNKSKKSTKAKKKQVRFKKPNFKDLLDNLDLDKHTEMFN